MRNNANIVTWLSKIPLYTMLVLWLSGPLTDNLQAKNTPEIAINKEPISIEQQNSMTADQFYNHLMQKNYDYKSLFQQVWQEKKKSSLRNDIYKEIIEQLAGEGEYEEKYRRDYMDILIFILTDDLDPKIKEIMEKRMAESKREERPNHIIIKIYNGRIKRYIEHYAKMELLQGELKDKQEELKKLRKKVKDLDDIEQSLKQMRDLFISKKQ